MIMQRNNVVYIFMTFVTIRPLEPTRRPSKSKQRRVYDYREI